MSSGVYRNNFMIIFNGIEAAKKKQKRKKDVHYLDDFRK